MRKNDCQFTLKWIWTSGFTRNILNASQTIADVRYLKWCGFIWFLLSTLTTLFSYWKCHFAINFNQYLRESNDHQSFRIWFTHTICIPFFCPWHSIELFLICKNIAAIDMRQKQHLASRSAHDCCLPKLHLLVIYIDFFLW